MNTRRRRLILRSYKASKSFERLCLSEDQAVYEAREENELPKRRVSHKLVDLFCGAGGMTLGFTEAFGHHFKPVWANDFNKHCVETYAANFGNHCVSGDIVDLLQDSSVTIPQADVVIGGPPCQAKEIAPLENFRPGRGGDPKTPGWDSLRTFYSGGEK